MIDLSIVIPVLNEADNIGLLIRKIQEILSGLKINYEIIIIDGGSTDDTVKICKKLGVKVLLQLDRGYAKAILKGLTNAQGDWLITMDADFSHPVEFILNFLKYKDEAEVVIASRYIKKGASYTGILRNIISRFLCFIFRNLFSIPINDITSGFRMYKRTFIEDLDISVLYGKEFEILVEILIEAYRMGYIIKEIPFIYIPRKKGKSHIPGKLFRLFKGYLTIFFKYFKIRETTAFSDYDEKAFYSINFLQRYWQRKRYRIIMDFVKEGKNKAIVDLGCGSSKIIQDLSNAVAVDISIDKLRYIRKSNKFLINADIMDLPFKNEVFSCIICSEVIEHIDTESIFFEINRILMPKGILVIGTPDYNKIIWRIIELFYGLLQPSGYKNEHIKRYNKKSLEDILKKYGFEILQEKYILDSELIIKAQKL